VQRQEQVDQNAALHRIAASVVVVWSGWFLLVQARVESSVVCESKGRSRDSRSDVLEEEVTRADGGRGPLPR
jgi:hypothetical protein